MHEFIKNYYWKGLYIFFISFITNQTVFQATAMSTLAGRKIPYLLTKQEMNTLQTRIHQLNLPSLTLLSSHFYQFQIYNQLIGYIQPSFIPVLQTTCSDIYQINNDHRFVTFHPNIEELSFQEKTKLLNLRNQQLHQQGYIKGWRNEYLPVSTSYHGEPFFLLERAMIPYFGIKAYGVHVNGFICDPITNEITHLWVGRRSKQKSTWPGMLDHVVAGGQPYGISLQENVIKECAEEANIPRELAMKAKAVSAVSYIGYDERFHLKRDTLFCYDLQLPNDFLPTPVDQEVESFECHKIEWIVEKLIYQSDDEYKPNCNLVVTDFLIRRGFIDPESPNYLELLASLRQGDCK